MTDVVCIDDLDVNATEYNDPIAELEQDIYHRIITPQGWNIDDPDFGLGLTQRLGSPEDPTLASRIDAECKKDDRVASSKTIVERISGDGDPNGVYRISITIQPQGSVIIEAGAIVGPRRIT